MAMRKSILHLVKVMGGIAGMMSKITEESPEYYALNCLTDEEADVAASLGLRKPRTLEYVANKCGKSLDETKKILDRLGHLGVLKIYTENGQTLYFMQIFAPGTLEMMVGCTENVKEHPEIAKAFEAYTRGLMESMGTMLPYGASMMRVIPIESAIASDTQAVPYEKISYYLDKYDTFSVSPCSCRRSRRLIGEGCGHLEDDMCVQMGSGAEYFIKTGKARQITREEAEAIFKKAEENGLMHQMPNLEGPGESAAICNCCACSCFAIRISTMFNCPDAERSNYHAEINQENCVACGQCVENCPTNAVKLGQKLCTKTPIETKKYDTVRNTVWGKDKWNVNYRENRQDTLETGTAPCKTACPAHIAVQGYIRLASLGRYKDALELIKKENPFPAICGRICPHKCEDACTRGQIDKGVAIDEIKKFIADKDKNSSERFIPTKKHDYSMKNIAVIGSGPAGLSCAYYLAVDGYNVTVFEKENKLGGMMTLGIPAFRLEKDVVEAEIDILRELGVKFVTGVEVGKDKTIDELKKEGFDGFYLAIGASAGRKLGIEGEDAKGVILGVDFLKDVALEKARNSTATLLSSVAETSQSTWQEPLSERVLQPSICIRSNKERKCRLSMKKSKRQKANTSSSTTVSDQNVSLWKTAKSSVSNSRNASPCSTKKANSHPSTMKTTRSSFLQTTFSFQSVKESSGATCLTAPTSNSTETTPLRLTNSLLRATRTSLQAATA